jgi:tetratricopeptide (TPR) repeat protein
MREVTLSLPEAVSHARRAVKLGHLDEAERLCRAILSANSDHFEAIHLVAIIQSRRGLHVEALANYERALAIRPDHAQAIHNRGLTLYQLMNFEQALASYDKALTILPDYAEALYSRGIALKDLKRYDEALASYESALAIQPNNAEVLNNRGNMLKVLKRFDESLASYDQALAIRPDYVEAISNRGLILHELKNFDQALACYDQALAIRPNCAEVLYDRGNTLRELKRFEEALIDYDKALGIQPNYPETLFNRGLTCHDLHRFEDALSNYSQALIAKPDLTDVHLNEAICHLLIGDFDRGWEKYEWRWQSDQAQNTKRNFAQPMWLGLDDIADKTILLHAEQGFGDTIQFCRYVRLVAEKTPNVILEVQPSLKRLLSVVTGARIVLARGEPLPHFDLHCPLLSLPRVFATRLATIPPIQQFLSIPRELLSKWESKLGPKIKPHVGIVLSGSPVHKNDNNRSISLNALLALLNLPIQVVSLQKDVRSEDQSTLNAHAVDIANFGPELTDFLDTAALVSLMDVVISVDTSVAHLAATVGRPTWILLPFTPDWRWMLDREDSPWYSTARLFRQPRIGDWDSVIQRVIDELRSLLMNAGLTLSHISPEPNASKKTTADSLKCAVAFHRQGKFAEAKSLYQEIIALDPTQYDAMQLLGAVLVQSGETEEGLKILNVALAIRPDAAEALYNRGIAQTKLGQPEAAISSFSGILLKNACDVAALQARGDALRARGRYPEALADYISALELNPENATLWNKRGLVLSILDRPEDAVTSFEKALTLDSTFYEAFNNCGAELAKLNRHADALARFDQAARLKPDQGLAHRNRGTALNALNRLQEALVSFDKALAINPNDAGALNGRGVVLQATGHHEDAIAAYKASLSINPLLAQAKHNLGMAHLLTGDFIKGWQEYEARFEIENGPRKQAFFSDPGWSGQEPLSGKTILLHGEQGLGDIIMFVRYVPKVTEMGAKVILAIPAELKLMLGQIKTVRHIFVPNEPLPAFDFHCPLMSLPLTFGTTLETIPANIPYLHAPPDRIFEWSRRLGQARLPRIGIAWSGNPHHTNDRNRSISLELLLAIRSSEIELVSLQNELRDGDDELLREHPDIRHFGSEIKDFADTAALISLMDLVISVDTSIAHLAGAMGRPVWVLLPFFPDWRWLLEREDSPWYPTTRLFRQHDARDWDGVIQRVQEALRHFVERAAEKFCS